MKKLLKGIIISSIFSLSPIAMASEKAIHWGYDQDISPEHWGSLSGEFKTCSTGKNQSPINITHAFDVVDKKNIDISYTISPQDIVFNGHTVQVNSDSLDDYIVLDQNKYILKQFHFHTPSENQIHGISYPLEAHFVHANEDGELVVLAVMFELGPKNSEISKLWKSISTKENEVKELKQIVNMEKLLPETREYYRFTGSLTTPPCDEGVSWVVLKEPLQISQEQIDAFKHILKHPSNNRPIQPAHGRIIIAD